MKTKPIAPIRKEDLEDAMDQQKEGRPVVRRARSSRSGPSNSQRVPNEL